MIMMGPKKDRGGMLAIIMEKMKKNHYEDGKESEISGQEMINRIVRYISDRSNWKGSYKDIGSLEEVEIDGIGTLDARVDTGNEGHNVLRATDINIDDNKVEFTTDNDITISLPLQDTVIINVGAGIREKRPVVAMDMKLGRKIYKNVMFSLSDRDGNDYPILIGIKFLKDNNFRVDVSSKNILESINKAKLPL